MGAKLALLALGLLLAAGVSGCALQNTFDCLDRHCYLADWCNCNSCVGECYRPDGYNHRWACPCQNPAPK
jgi:hypothetical protein